MTKTLLLSLSLMLPSIVYAEQVKPVIFGKVDYYDTYELVSPTDALINRRYSNIGEISNADEMVYELSRIDSPDTSFFVRHFESNFVITEMIDRNRTLVRSNEIILKGVNPRNIRLNVTTTMQNWLQLKKVRSVEVKFFPNTDQQITLSMMPVKINQKLSSNAFISAEVQFECNEQVCLENLLGGQVVEISL